MSTFSKHVVFVLVCFELRGMVWVSDPGVPFSGSGHRQETGSCLRHLLQVLLEAR